MSARTPLAQRLWSNVDFTTSDCWLWAGHLSEKGYGRLAGRDGRVTYAHRVSWELFNGPLPHGLMVLHKCDVRACVRPDHLVLGTAQDNSDDMIAKGRANGPKGLRNAFAKLDTDKVRDIRASEESSSALARRYGVNRSTVIAVRAGRAWAHV